MVNGRWLMKGRGLRFSVVAVVLLLGGCGHTQPLVRKGHFKAAQTGQTIGLEFIFDLSQFNYAPIVREEILEHRCFKEVLLTHDLADPHCEYVIRGNFNFYRVHTHNNAYYASIYLLLLPLITGVPYSHVDGGAMVSFEVYRGGVMLKTYEYADVFWDERGLWSLYPTPGPGQELRRLTRLFLKEIMRDLFGFKQPRTGSLPDFPSPQASTVSEQAVAGQ